MKDFLQSLAPKTKIGICLGIVLLGIAVVISVNLSSPTVSPTETPSVTIPPAPPPNKDDPVFVSPYNPNESYVSVMQPVWNTTLRFPNCSITSNSNPDALFINSIDAEDVITVTLPRQRLATDITKTKVLVVAPENMQDPYITDITKYAAILDATFTENSDGTWSASFTLGYSEPAYTMVYLLFVYDNNIECFTAMRVTQKHKYSKTYYQWLNPGKNIAEFHLKSNDKQYTYCFYPEETKTLAEWVRSDMNHDGWLNVQGLLVNPAATHYITEDRANMRLVDNLTIELLAVNGQLPLNTHQFTPNNPSYLTYYMHTNIKTITDMLGIPTQTQQFANITRLEYSNIIFYVSDSKGVIQIDAKPGTTHILNDLPTHTCTGEELTRQLRLLVIPYTDYQDKSDYAAGYHAHSLTVKTQTCYISFVWEDEKQINPDYTEFTRIVIHSGEEYIY